MSNVKITEQETEEMDQHEIEATRRALGIEEGESP